MGTILEIKLLTNGEWAKLPIKCRGWAITSFDKKIGDPLICIDKVYSRWSQHSYFPILNWIRVMRL